MPEFDIAPFGLPNTEPGEVWFEETRDITRVVVTFAGPAPKRVGLSYRRKVWPHQRVELLGDMDRVRPSMFGWIGIDDWFNTEWQRAAVRAVPLDAQRVELTFKGLADELRDYPDSENYNVTYRRTLGVRVDARVPVASVAVYTTAQPARTTLRVELDTGPRTRGRHIWLEGYNAVIDGPTEIALPTGKRGPFEFTVTHMRPAHRYAYDDGLVTFYLHSDAITISLEALAAEGPIWFAEEGVYITRADDPTSFRAYRQRCAGHTTVAQQVKALPEQSIAGAIAGQPRPHPTSFPFGCKHARQKFWLEPNGDLVLHGWTLRTPEGPDTARFVNLSDGRFFFGLERWLPVARFADPYPALAFNLHARRGSLFVEQQAVAVPLLTDIREGEPSPDAPMAAVLRFRFRNDGDTPALAELPVAYSAAAGRGQNRLFEMMGRHTGHDDYGIPRVARDPLMIEDNGLLSNYDGNWLLRARYRTDMTAAKDGDVVRFTRELAPGETCALELAVPFLLLYDTEEPELAALEFDACHRTATEYWRQEGGRGARVRTPDPRLNEAYRGHWPAVAIADVGMVDDMELVNTSVGAITYGNFTNESVMILQELDQRGLHDEVRRRLATWVKYQSTVALRGNFTDIDGLFFGAGGFEQGNSYCQHHGWALWYLAEHFLFTGDADWFATVSDAEVKGADWIIRQRAHTRGDLPHSRGWEDGFLPAGALEDVTDYFYWLSTNVLTWRGLDAAGRALTAAGHPAAARIVRDAARYRSDLWRGLETARHLSPLVRLRDGRWVPHIPSRLYRRGRDFGWIREVLEGSVYLLLSGLYEPDSQVGQWILDDYQDTRYMNPPLGYLINDHEAEWFDRGGFSVQPNLLEGLRPYLDRDEPELYLWMFCNAWAACFREEINLMVEHPLPVLGYSNAVPMKTSDQANAMRWLVYQFVYEAAGQTLHLGRALPRAWFAERDGMAVDGVATRYGTVDLSYRPEGDALVAEVYLHLRRQPTRILVRFRHPESRPIRSVTINGQPGTVVDALRGDVDLTGLTGKLRVEARY